MTQINSSGKWWFPENDSIKIKGNLEFNQDKGGTIKLEDQGSYFINLDFRRKDFFLLGTLENDNELTVKVSYISKFNESFDENEYKITCILKIKYIFLNIHITNENDLKFNKIIITFTNIDNWISKYDIINKDIFVTIIDECNITITNNKNKSNIVFIVESLKEKSLEHYIGLKYILQGFFNFITTDKPIMIESLHGELSNPKYKSTEILYRSTTREPMVKVAVKSPFLFRHDEIKDKFESILNKWFKFYSDKDLILDLYLGLMYNNEIPLSIRFLSLFQALEVYHSSFIAFKSPKKKEREKRIENITEELRNLQINSETKKYLKILVKEKNYPSSKERLEEIYNKYDNIFPKLTAKLKDKKSFVKDIKDYRDKITHARVSYNELAHDVDFFWHVKNLELILQLCILSGIGFSNDKISEFYMIY